MATAELNQVTRILIASDDHAYAGALAQFLESADYELERCHDSGGVLRLTGRRAFDILVLDLSLNEDGDMDLVSFVRRQRPATQIILIFGSSQVDRALEGIRQGAFFYLPKSCQPSDVAYMVEKAIRAALELKTTRAHEQSVLEEMTGGTPAMERVVELITKVSPTDSTVLLLGESGTGKEVLANTIHRMSPRRDQAFVAINCAALPEQLLESEMFGHVKGAFTGAESDKLGLFQKADGGTLFLDEVGDMAMVTQAKLLRVLQNGEIRRVGDSETITVDVRVLAATNRNLVEAVREKAFREDLYFRLNVIQIAIPPLRERMDILPALVGQFIKAFNARYGKQVRKVSDDAAAFLQNYPFPGNIRELQSIIAHAVILADGDTITLADLPDHIRFVDGTPLALPHPTEDPITSLEEMEKRAIESALEKLRGNQTEAAKQLGISRSTLWRKMKEYGVSKREDKEAAEP